MLTNVLQKNPVLVLKECLAREFSEILEEPRVQQLLLLLDRINEYSYTVLENTLDEFEDNSDDETKRLDIQCRIQQLDIDMGLFNQKLIELRDSLKIVVKKAKRKPGAYSNCAGFKK